ncbi:MAG: adenine deaminase [Candidatus Aenigmarchaeota archaeon ex4484_56]|nr:MAG: adenine deaminase [Candidatus Aenigmarchaeota archaeon ex4484_56]
MRVIKSNVVNVFNETIEEKFVVVNDDKIVAVLDNVNNDVFADYSNFYLLPGFIDGHVHIESSLLTPYNFSDIVAQHGTVAVVIDPHEIANVYGVDGIKFMLNDSKNAQIDLFFGIPSCVPSTHLETSGGRIGIKETKQLIKENNCVGLAEVMNVQGVLSGDKEILEKIKIAKNKICDGHAPLLSGEKLNRYIFSGIQSDHECITLQEAIEKHGLGMWIMIREGSSAKNLADLKDIAESERVMFVSDDIHINDIIKNGHLDRILRKAVSIGIDPIKAIKNITLRPAEYFNLEYYGAVSPGYYASFVIVEDLKKFKIKDVYIKGRKICKQKGKKYKIKNSINIKPIKSDDLYIKSKNKKEKINIIKIIKNQIVTDWIKEFVYTNNGIIYPDVNRDLLLAFVVERHKKTGNIGKGFVKGFGLKEGAIASTVAHDSHNIVVVGTDYIDILYAIKFIEKIGGGFIVVKNKKIVSKLELPIAGIMSDKPAEKINLDKINNSVNSLGCKLESPFGTLSFLALPVIPKLKLTDKGLVDVDNFKIINIW